ncbi:MAG: metalloregulator ArsR/SmtB family transcription factor [Actinomycetota bacterium]|jgi:DNA-binding transcriptional ArsR family regulator|nr:metalloregulator ArsR/SmtB family transcription factor [Actinomycetota bacterium]MDQ3353026.1 metalloregulator ArsR/SmtB family transcription factor [Actinomycetota bacterium]
MVTTFSRREVERISHTLAVLGEPHRLQMLRWLRRGPRTAGYLAQAIGVSPSLASHHLSVLVSSGLVSRRQVGTFVCYSADRTKVKALHSELGRLAGALLPDIEPSEASAPC